jgi:hypothetical protein
MNVREAYGGAYLKVWEAGYKSDILWAFSLEYVTPSPRHVISETAWVIINSGFRYAVVQKLWPKLRAAFRNFHPRVIRTLESECRAEALSVLNYPRKIDAIIEVARIIDREGVAAIVQEAQDPPKLTRLPFIGKTTCWHLAKLLGADVVKPDIHLQRAATAAGYDSPLALCQAIRGDGSDLICSRLTVIDSVLWRYGEQMKARGWPEWGELFFTRGVQSRNGGTQ